MRESRRERGRERENVDTETHREGCVTTGSLKQYIDKPKTAGNHQKPERGKEWTLPEPLKGANPANASVLDVWAPELGANTFLSF